METPAPLSMIYKELVTEIMTIPESQRPGELARCRELLIQHGFSLEHCMEIEAEVMHANREQTVKNLESFRDELRQVLHEFLT